MKIVMFYQSLISDWNHGTAHFLRGIASELLSRGHELTVFEPRDSWSMQNLVESEGTRAIEEFRASYPHLSSRHYEIPSEEIDEALRDAELVLVHSWNDPVLVRKIGRSRRAGKFALFYHDTQDHHSRREFALLPDLSDYDGVLASDPLFAEQCIRQCVIQRAWTWHEAVDERVFYRRAPAERSGDLVWIGGWSEPDRDHPLREFLYNPVCNLKLQAEVFGGGYSPDVRTALKARGIRYGGWVANYRLPELFAKYPVTLHLPGLVPPIRIFEALACGIPLIVAPGPRPSRLPAHCEELFEPGVDYLVARSSREMERHLMMILNEPALASALSENGTRLIRERHTCAHRVDELFRISGEFLSNSRLGKAG